MSTIQADVLQLSRLVDGMLLKWCLQSGSFLLGEVEEGRNGWEICQGATLSLGCVGALPNGWLPLWPLPTQLSTRQLGRLRAGWWQAYAESSEQGSALVSCKGKTLHTGHSGSPPLYICGQRVSPRWPRPVPSDPAVFYLQPGVSCFSVSFPFS